MNINDRNKFTYDNLIDVFKFIEKYAEQTKLSINIDRESDFLIIKGFDKTVGLEEFTLKVPPITKSEHVIISTERWLEKQ